MDLSTRTYDRLRDLIVENQLPPEKRLIEKDLADRYERLPGILQDAELAESVDEHEGVIDLIESGDGDAAAAAIQAHWERARERSGTFVGRYWG